jgi:hypothetical protein
MSESTKNVRNETSDHLGRDAKDFAIEFGGYLAKAAERYITVMNDEHSDYDIDCDALRGLINAIYEFRKRVAKAY